MNRIIGCGDFRAKCCHFAKQFLAFSFRVMVNVEVGLCYNEMQKKKSNFENIRLKHPHCRPQ